MILKWETDVYLWTLYQIHAAFEFCFSIVSLLAQRTLNLTGAAGDKVVILRSLLTHADGLSFLSLNRLNFVNIVTLYLLLILNYCTEFVFSLSHTHIADLSAAAVSLSVHSV